MLQLRDLPSTGPWEVELVDVPGMKIEGTELEGILLVAEPATGLVRHIQPIPRGQDPGQGLLLAASFIWRHWVYLGLRLPGGAVTQPRGRIFDALPSSVSEAPTHTRCVPSTRHTRESSTRSFVCGPSVPAHFEVSATP